MDEILIATEFFNNRDYRQAFNLFQKIAENVFFTDEDRSEAYDMLGLIVLIDPNIDIVDESGLIFFSKAIELDNSNITALLNIIGSFGVSPNNHRNSKLFYYSLSRLQELEYDFTDDEVNRIEEKRKWANTLDEFQK